MPKFIEHGGKEKWYATERQLLAFANKMREAGAADPLEALMPSKPKSPETCLIANALNFECSVHGVDDDSGWFMHLPANMSRERAQKIAAAVGCELIEGWHDGVGTFVQEASIKNDAYSFDRVLVIRLPEKIGNTADAFDQGNGWTKKYAMEY